MFCYRTPIVRKGIDISILLQCSASLEILPDFPRVLVVEPIDLLIIPLVVFVDVCDLCIWVLVTLPRALLSLNLPVG